MGLLKDRRPVDWGGVPPAATSRLYHGLFALFQETVGFFRSIHIPLGLLSSHDVAIRPVVEEKKAGPFAD